MSELSPAMWDAISKVAMVFGGISLAFLLIGLFGAFIDDLISDILEKANK